MDEIVDILSKIGFIKENLDLVNVYQKRIGTDICIRIDIDKSVFTVMSWNTELFKTSLDIENKKEVADFLRELNKIEIQLKQNKDGR